MLYNCSLPTSSVSRTLKEAAIIPVPKKKTAASLTDYRPVALTSVQMKALEKLVINYVTSLLPKEMDPYQFAYRENRRTYDAVAMNIHRVLSYLEPPSSKSIDANAYCRILFVDYS